jgi:ABC-2 type transport system permease protein
MTSQENYIAFETIVRKEIVRFTRIWTQTLLPPVITQSLYFVIFGKFIGAQIGSIHGINYMAFIVPGLIMMAVINSSFANVVSSFFSAKFQRSIEELIVSSTPIWVMMTGYLTGGVVRGILVGILVFIVSSFFAVPQIHNIFIIAVFIFLTSVLFSIAGLINGIYAKKFDDVAILPTFVLTPLTYLGGIFYSIQSLPVFWQNVSKLNPILYMINGFRYGFFGVSDVNVWLSLFMMFVFILVFALWGFYLLSKGIGLKN